MNTFNFYHYKTLSAFLTDLSSGTFTENDLAFIKESKLLYTHGLYYDCTGLGELQIKDLELINVIDEVLSLTVDKMVKASGLNADLSYSSNNEIIASAKSIAEALELLANFLSTGGIPDAPSDGVTYGRKDGSWVKANYSTPDEVLNIDELLSLIESEPITEVPTPEGVFEKVENAYNKGICYLDGGMVATGLVIPMVIAKAEVKNEQAGYEINVQYEVYYNESYSIKMKILALVEKDKSTVVMSQLVIPLIGTIAKLEDLSQMAALDGYSKPSSYSAISSNDSINKAIGKLEAGIQGGGTVDITDIFNRITSLSNGETASQEDYNTLLELVNSNTQVIVNTINGGLTTEIVSFFKNEDDAIYLQYIDYPYLVTVGDLRVLVIQKDLTIVTQSHNFTKALNLNTYKKADSYTEIRPTDTVMDAIGKLEAGLNSQGGGGSSESPFIYISLADYIGEPGEGTVKKWSELKSILDLCSVMYNESSGEVTVVPTKFLLIGYYVAIGLHAICNVNEDKTTYKVTGTQVFNDTMYAITINITVSGDTANYTFVTKSGTLSLS